MLCAGSNNAISNFCATWSLFLEWVTYEGTVSPELNQLTKDIWSWCLEKNIALQATHLAGTLNLIADEESQVMRDRSNWMLCPRMFGKVNQRTGPLQVDLFASSLTNQLRDYVSWRPNPGAMAIDPFTLNWTKFKGYANPPWSLVERVLTHIRNQKSRVILIAPIWRSQAWYPVGNTSTGTPPTSSHLTLIIPTHRVNTPDIVPPLAIWVTSGIDTKVKTFQRMLQNSSLPPGGRRHQGPMTPDLENEYAGVTREIQIPFLEI